MSREYSVRVTTAEDGPAVSTLLQASYPVLMGPHYDPAALAAALPAMTKAHPGLLRSGRYFVAETEDRHMIGCGGWSLERPGTGELEAGLGHIRHFGTHPAWTGRAVGRALYRACETQARAQGVRRWECNASLNAEGFYRALGFQPIRRVEVRLGPEVLLPGILMGRAL